MDDILFLISFKEKIHVSCLTKHSVKLLDMWKEKSEGNDIEFAWFIASVPSSFSHDKENLTILYEIESEDEFIQYLNEIYS